MDARLILKDIGSRVNNIGTIVDTDPNNDETTSYVGKMIQGAGPFGGGDGTTPMLFGHYSGNSREILSVIAKKGSAWNSNYSIYVKIRQHADCTVRVALLKGGCTIDISESTTAPTNISEWSVNYGLFGNIVSPEITSLEQRVAALKSKV